MSSDAGQRRDALLEYLLNVGLGVYFILLALFSALVVTASSGLLGLLFANLALGSFVVSILLVAWVLFVYVTSYSPGTAAASGDAESRT